MADSGGRGVAVAGVELTGEQRAAADAVVAWYRGGSDGGTRQFALGGYAGTGKSTVIRHLIRNDFRGLRVRACAFTGKAADVLRRRGVAATTIHSLIYDVRVAPDGSVRFVLKDKIPADLIVVDEASMVSAAIYRDLLGFGLPVLFVGDTGQLEPIGDDPGVMRSPDAMLETVHRQALLNPIIGFGERVRRGAGAGKPREESGDHGTLRVINGRMDDDSFISVLTETDQVIVGYNKTRVTLNEIVREYRGLGGLVCVGDRLVCLKNDRNFGIFNGQQAVVTDVGREVRGCVHLGVEDADGLRFTVPACVRQFGRPSTLEEAQNVSMRPRNERGPRTYWDYGYAVTVWKAQGSEWGRVTVFEEIHRRVSPSRWRYTAATRAENELVYVT